jgi:superfamily I DNA/RNA helicase
LNFGTFLAGGIGLHANIVAIKEVVVDKQEDASYTIATIWKSKGLEWSTVVIDDNCLHIPEDSTLEEVLYSNQVLECMYVAVTRAKNTVIIPPDLQYVIDNYIDFKRLDRLDRA